MAEKAIERKREKNGGGSNANKGRGAEVTHVGRKRAEFGMQADEGGVTVNDGTRQSIAATPTTPPTPHPGLHSVLIAQKPNFLAYLAADGTRHPSKRPSKTRYD